MAMFRLEAKIFSRENRGRSIIAAAAYRAAKTLEDTRDGRIYDYARRLKGVLQTKILTPEGAPDWALESGSLWNAVEAGEKRKDAQLAREFILAVPPELNSDAQFDLAAAWARKELVPLGMAAEVSLHHAKGGHNPHVHILTTLRKLEPSGFSARKPREWNEVGVLVHWRESWAEAVNAALEAAGRPERVDHRSLEARGIDRDPEPKIGVAATAMQRKGTEPDPQRCQEVRHVKLMNEVRPLMKSVRSQGEVAQHGAGRTWWERSITLMARAKDSAKAWVRKTWQKLVERNRDDGLER